MKNILRRLKPDRFGDLVAFNALYRPGPIGGGLIDDLIKRRHGKVKVEYPHPLLEEILRETYGVIVYQEQVMQIAQVYAGYTLGQADNLRRAMGKKKAEAMAAEKELFLLLFLKTILSPHLGQCILRKETSRPGTKPLVYLSTFSLSTFSWESG